MSEFDVLKESAKGVWSDFAVMENFTAAAAPRLIDFAGVSAEHKVLDVACGTGVVALTASRISDKVVGTDLTPSLIRHAKKNAEILGLNTEFLESDVEALPYENDSFDIVLSQFGHMFAPQPYVAIAEMLRVLKSGGKIAFSTWPPELFMGSLFRITSSYAPPSPIQIEPPTLWGNVDIVKARLGPSVTSLTFDRDRLLMPGLSVPHLRKIFETGAGPLKNIISELSFEPEKLTQLRSDIDDAIEVYYENNRLRMDYLMTSAIKF